MSLARVPITYTVQACHALPALEPVAIIIVVAIQIVLCVMQMEHVLIRIIFQVIEHAQDLTAVHKTGGRFNFDADDYGGGDKCQDDEFWNFLS